ILEWWSGKKISEVNGTNCRKYVKWRTSQRRRTQTSSGKSPTYITDQTARHDLKTLRAALRWYKREVDSAIFVPTVTLPSKAPRPTRLPVLSVSLEETANRTTLRGCC